MPLVHAADWPRESTGVDVLSSSAIRWRRCRIFPASVRDVCDRLRTSQPEQLEAQADALLAAQTAASRCGRRAVPDGRVAGLLGGSREPARRSKMCTELDVPGVCPVCGTLPVASVVRADPRSQGFAICTAPCARPNGTWCV